LFVCLFVCLFIYLFTPSRLCFHCLMNSETHRLFIKDHPCTPHRQGHTEADLRAHEQNVKKAAAELAENEQWRERDEGGLLLEKLTPIRSGGSWSWRFADSKLDLHRKGGA
jgi:hypothetical protein